MDEMKKNDTAAKKPAGDRFGIAARIFRKKSLERVSSPEELQDFIQVSNPAVWLIIGTAILLLVGCVVWGIFGRIEATCDGVVIAEKGDVTFYVAEQYAKGIRIGQTVKFNNTSATVDAINEIPICAEDDFSEYAQHVGGYGSDTWVYAVHCAGQSKDGVFPAFVLLDEISPFSLIFGSSTGE